MMKNKCMKVKGREKGAKKEKEAEEEKQEKRRIWFCSCVYLCV